jgi:apolipoprotein D and lipocalin family protein
MSNRLISTLIGMAGVLMACYLTSMPVFAESGSNSTAQGAVTVGKASKQPLQTVPHVDLKRYMGQWYEIAAIPMFFERRCTSGARAQYRLLPDGLVEVVNSCQTASGERISSTGRARVGDPQSNAKLKVTFVNLLGWRFWMGGDYWIIDLDADYQTAVIGDPSRRYAWILSRTTALPPETLARLQQVLRAQGYDPCRLMIMPQPGGLQVKRSLCD